MEDESDAKLKIGKLKDGETCCFNMFQDGGARCAKAHGMYLLFEIPLYGGQECYEGTYYESQLDDLISKVFSWT